MVDETRNPGEVLVARIEALRLGRGWTIGELAEHAEMAPEYLERFLADTPDVGVSVILRLSGALEVEPEDLLGGIEWAPDGRGGGEYRILDSEQ
jgi:transcriptional regulator with XRE-family HTH domain